MTFDPIERRLTPTEGLWLTQKEVAEETNRIFSQLMYLGVNDSPDNYTEWTQEQYDAWQEEYHPAPEPEVETTDEL